MCYLVVFDGYCGDWGADFYCYGVYSSREKAEAASEELRKFAKGRLGSPEPEDLKYFGMDYEDRSKKYEWFLEGFIKIIELPMDESLVPKHTLYFGYSDMISTSAHVGGHIE